MIPTTTYRGCDWYKCSLCARELGRRYLYDRADGSLICGPCCDRLSYSREVLAAFAEGIGAALLIEQWALAGGWAPPEEAGQ